VSAPVEHPRQRDLDRMTGLPGPAGLAEALRLVGSAGADTIGGLAVLRDAADGADA
jgi:hypothetical protein